MLFEVTEDVSHYMTLISMVVTVAAIFAYGYLLKNTAINHGSIQKPAHHLRNLHNNTTKRMINKKTDDIQSWITLKTKRIEVPDDEPSHILLALFSKQEMNQGGSQWKRKLHLSRENMYSS